MTVQVDVAVVGGGAAGLSAAFHARRKGASVILAERGRLGGDCTWTGCVPSKTLLERARAAHIARQFGWDGGVDFTAVMGHVHDTVSAVARDESSSVLAGHGIRVLEGEARFLGPRRLSVGGTAVSARVVVLATGASPLVPAIDGLVDVDPLTSETVWNLRSLPRRLAVLGGGPVGVEFTQAFARLGGIVTVVEAAERLLPQEEPETGRLLARVLKAEGVDVCTGAAVTAVWRRGDEVKVSTGQQCVTADAVLVAVGRRPVTGGLDLEHAGVRTDERGFISVDDRLRTTAEGIYAVGDVVGGLQFTHVGDEMGRRAVDDALGRWPRRFDSRAVPWVTFTDPEVGRVGLTEVQAYQRHGERARVAYLPMRRTDRARTAGVTDGFVKLIAGPRRLLGDAGGGRLLGATVVCPTGGDVVHEAAVVLQTGAFTGRLAQTVHAYPTWALAVRQAAAQFFRAEAGRQARPARPHPGADG